MEDRVVVAEVVGPAMAGDDDVVAALVGAQAQGEAARCAVDGLGGGEEVQRLAARVQQLQLAQQAWQQEKQQLLRQRASMSQQLAEAHAESCSLQAQLAGLQGGAAVHQQG